MGLRLVNTAPGESLEPLKPGQPYQLGLRSDTGSVALSSLRVDHASSSIGHAGALPEEDAALAAAGAQVSLTSVERLYPLTGTQVSRAVQGGALVLTKNLSAHGEESVYEVSVPVKRTDSLLAHFRFKKRSWSQFAPSWTDVPDATGVFFGLEHGPLNTAVTVFLAGNNRLVRGGPLQDYYQARPEQVSFDFPWEDAPDGSELDIFLFFNLLGQLPAYTPSHVPLVEVWAKLPGESLMQPLGGIPALDLGAFPQLGAGINNHRPGPSETARIVFGNAGQAGDILELLEWRLYPDVRIGLRQGLAMPGTQLQLSPDTPCELSVRPPDSGVPSRWLKEGSPTTTLYHQPGRPHTPLYLSVETDGKQAQGWQRTEPRLTTRTEGFVLEGFLSAQMGRLAGVGSGVGLALSDGQRSYRLALVQLPERREVGLVQDATLLSRAAGYHLGGVDCDWRSLKHVRLVGDRLRNWLDLYVEGQRVLHLPFTESALPPAPNTEGRVFFGHTEPLDTHGTLHLARLLYCTRYCAWESEDGDVPGGPDWSEAGGAGSSRGLVDGLLEMRKEGSALGATFSCATDVDYHKGLLLDFSCQVLSWTPPNAPPFGAGYLGVGVALTLGSRRLELGFYDCGLQGRRIGLLTQDVSPADILAQTEVGRAVSAPVDWTQLTDYRLIYKPYERIEVWAGSLSAAPLLTLPWSVLQDFALPEDEAAAGIHFGHFLPASRSISRWGHVRWSVSSGYDVSLTPELSEPPPRHLFGGRTYLSVSASETLSGV